VRQFGTGNVFSAQTTTGSTALFVNAAGNVGVGTTSPSYPFHLSAAGTATSVIGTFFQPNLTTGGAVTVLAVGTTYATGASGAAAFMNYGTNASNVFQLSLAGYGSSAIHINSTGVGIGTTSPGALLDVYGGTTRNYAVTDSTIITESTGDNFSFVQFRVNTNGTPKYTYLTLKNSGQSNQFWICANNSWTTGVYLVQNGTAWSSSSDARLKNIIEPISNALSKVEQINPCIYSLKDDETNKRRVGVIAQDVYKVLPEAVDSTPESEQMMGVQYSDLIPLALAAIKELSAENTQLKTQLAAMDARLAALEAKLNSQ
jgi:hypothetical protein